MKIKVGMPPLYAEMGTVRDRVVVIEADSFYWDDYKILYLRKNDDKSAPVAAFQEWDYVEILNEDQA